MEEIAPGTIMDGLRIEAVAGRGGFSVVYRATQLSSGRPLAVKVLSKADPSSRRLLAREAELLAAVHHPGIVPFRGFRQDDHRDVLITDWVEGESLHARLLRDGPITADQALWVLEALADPLDHLHRMDIIHRDISPSNIIVGPDGALTVIDLGIGHHVESSTLTRDDLLAGTPKYLAPEIIRGERADGRADQYSVGVMLHELVTGQSPFPVAGKVATALHHQLHSVPVPLDEIDHRISPTFANAILRSLQKNQEDRFVSMAEFSAIAAGRNLGDRGASDDAVNSRRSPRLSSGIGLGAALLVLAVAGYLLFDNRDVQTAAPGSNTEVTAQTPEESGEPAGATEDEPVEVQGTAAPTAVSPNLTLPGQNWVEGAGAQLACNLLQGSDFANGTVPTDYFGDPPGREQVVTDLGFAQSWALEVGLPGAFGQYGEIVPVLPGQTYSFVGWFDRVGEIEDTEIGISFLSADYQPLSTGAKAKTPADGPGFVGVVAVPVPPEAGFAVPYLFKDGSEGVMIADELIFGVAEQCQSEIEVANS